jgi:hypothetical protein
VSTAPNGTRPWRKSWRKKWREESTFRSLSPLAKLACIFSEENADDEGQLTSTVRQMADALGGWHHEQKIPRMTMWRAWRELEAAGLWSIQAGRTAEREAGRTPSVITRLNFKRYQETPKEEGTQPGTQSSEEAGHSSRGTQTKETKRRPPKAAEGTPQTLSLKAELEALWQAKYGHPPASWGAGAYVQLASLAKRIDAAEVIRRFRNYLTTDKPFFAGHPLLKFATNADEFVVGNVRDIRVGSAPAESHESFAARGGGVQPW